MSRVSLTPRDDALLTLLQQREVLGEGGGGGWVQDGVFYQRCFGVAVSCTQGWPEICGMFDLSGRPVQG